MCVLRRLDAVLEPTKKDVLATKAMLDQAGITEQGAALPSAAGQAFYNTSKFSLRDLKSRGSQQQLKADFDDYLDGFSQNVQDILVNFEFRNVLVRLSKSDALGTLIEKFLDPDVNLSPNPVLNGDGSVRQPAMDNHSMGTVFEELVRKFNEENNEEAGEHWTPRDAVRLMTTLMFRPIAREVKAGSYLLYDCACGTGGRLTVAEETLQKLSAEHGQKVVTHLYGQEINPGLNAPASKTYLRASNAKSPSSASTAPASSRMSSRGSSMCGRRRRGCLRRSSSRSTRARRSGTRMATPRSRTARRRGRRERRVGAAGSI